jgi:lipopolysaccharide transport system permease protein
VSIAPIVTLLRQSELIREMAIRDAKEINQGSALGGSWLVLRPLMQTAAYVVIVSFVFQSRLSADSGHLDYAMYVLSGMVPWQLAVHVMAVAPSLLRNHASIVKQIVYPIETLPLRGILVGSMASLVTLLVYVVLAIATGQLHWTIILLPIPVLMLVTLLIGIAWIMMILGAVVADLREIVGAALNVLIFVTPVLISSTMVRPEVWAWIRMNPLTHVVICFRDVFSGEIHPISWWIFSLVTLVSITTGSCLISRLRLRIVDYL